MESLSHFFTAIALNLPVAESKPKPIRVLFWDEQQPEQKQAYGGKFLGETIAAHFRSGCGWQVGQGRVFYFRPGHETYPVLQQVENLRVPENAIRWLATPAR